MGFRLPSIRRPSFSATQAISKGVEVPKGYLAVYVGDKMTRFVIPVTYLNQPSFQELLNQAEEEFGFHHPAGGLTIPCREDDFLNLTSRLNGLPLLLRKKLQPLRARLFNESDGDDLAPASNTTEY
ncbi:hypothetical protein RJT34_31818 [Clitoria ternatea]|uniref:Uncharacterized protein n=1 Tax=Clitoria ternatea TaxID=43366 RepID=A0AAN9F2R8_CLITE